MCIGFVKHMFFHSFIAMKCLHIVLFFFTVNSSVNAARSSLNHVYRRKFDGKGIKFIKTFRLGYVIRVRAHFGQSNFPFFQQKRKKEILLILIIFAYFKVQKKREKKKMVRKIDHFFIFLILKLNSKIQKILLTAKSDILLFLFS